MNIDLILFLDGYATSYLDKNISPFLHDLKSKNNFAEIETEFGFRGLGSMIFFGEDIPESKVWADYKFCNDSKFKYLPSFLMRFFGRIDRITKTEKIRRRYRIFLNLIFKTFFDKKIPISGNLVDFEMMRYFCFSEGRNEMNHINSIFHKKNVIFRNWPTSSLNVQKFFNGLHHELTKINGDKVIFSKLPFADHIGHLTGPNDKEFLNKIKNIDMMFAKLVENLKSLDVNYNLTLFSDTGMSNVYDWVDILPFLRYLFKEHQIIYWVDSIMVRFWNIDIHNNQLVKKITRYMNNRGFEVLSKQNLTDKGIYFKGFQRKYGQLIFYLKEGAAIYPDFYRSNDKPYGMHGYYDCDDENSIPFILSTRNFNNEKIKNFLNVNQFLKEIMSEYPL